MQRLAGQATFAEEIAGSQNCDHSFLTLLGDDGLLDLAALNVKNGIGRVALSEYNLLLLIIGRALPAVYFREKLFGIERELSLPFHCKPALSRGVILWGDCECVATATVRKPDRQVGIEHEQAFTDRLYEIQWVDFPHVRFLRTF